MPNELYERGLDIRKQVLGADYVDGVLKNVDSFNAEFQEFVTEACWGRVWGGEALSRKQRSLNNLCILAALNRPLEFELHFRGALRNGCTVAEIRETLMQIAVYCGLPAAVEGFRIGRRVLEDEGLANP